MLVIGEGVELAGKSQTLARAMKKLENDPELESYNFIITREPGGTKIGKLIRKILLGTEDLDFPPKTELLLYLADRSDHYHSFLKPALENEKNIILSDRYWETSIVYQSLYHNAANLKEMKWLHNFVTDNLKPDIMFLFDSKQPHNREAKNRYDIKGDDFREATRNYYNNLKEYTKKYNLINYPIIKIDTSNKEWDKYINKVYSEIKNMVLK